MKSFRDFITEKREEERGAFPVSRKDAEKLQRMSRETTSQSSAERISRGLESSEERSSRTKRVVPSARTIQTPEGPIITNIPKSERTPEEQILRAELGRNNPRGRKATHQDKISYLGKQRDSGGRVSADIEASAARGDVDIRRNVGTEPRKPIKPGSYVVDTSSTEKPKQTTVNQAEISKRAQRFRQAFGKPTGANPFTGEPSYVPPQETDEPGRRAQRSSSPRSYASVKSEIEAAKGFGGVKSGGLQMRPAPEPVKKYRANRALRKGIPDPFSSTKPFSQADFEKSLTRTGPKQLGFKFGTSGETSKKFTSEPVRNTIPKRIVQPTTTDSVKTKTVEKTPTNIGATNNIKPFKQLKLDIEKVTQNKPKVRGGQLAMPTGSPMHQGAYDAAFGKVQNVKVSEIKPEKVKSTKTVQTIKTAVSRSPQAYRGLGVGAKELTTPKYKPRAPQTYRGGAQTDNVSFKDFEKKVQDSTKNVEKQVQNARRETAAQIKGEFKKAERKSVSGFTKGAAALSGIGAYKEFGYGKRLAKSSGASDTQANISGGLRAAGAFLGGVGGAFVGRKAAGSLGGTVGGGYGYTKGAEIGSWLSKKYIGV